MNRSATVRTCCGIALALVLVAIIGKASAYVDLAPTLAKIISDAKLIAVVELSSFDKDTGVVNLKAVRALGGPRHVRPDPPSRYIDVERHDCRAGGSLD